MLTPLPEFNALRDHSVTAPKVWQRNFALAETLHYVSILLLQRLTRGDRRALLRRPSGYLTGARTLLKVIGYHIPRQGERPPLNDYLTLERQPRKVQTHLRIDR